REVRLGKAVLVRVVALQIEGLRRDPEVGGRMGGIAGRLRKVEVERERLLELGLHKRLVVREDEPTARAAFVQLRGVRDRSPPAVREASHLHVCYLEDVSP